MSIPVQRYDAAIFHLGQDLLTQVFTLNAHMNDGPKDAPGLLTLQRTSQVCSSWRGLVLSSSSLWGRVIDLTFLGQKKDEWGIEVIRRTRQAGLYVKSSFGNREAGERIDNFLVFLLTCHWTRIRSLEAIYWDEVILSLLQQPASILEVFRVSRAIPGALDHTTKDDKTKFELFANHAPLLRIFYVTNIPFSLDAPWMAHLHSLHLTKNQPHTFTHSQLLQAFSCMPFLEEITGITEYTLTPFDGAVSLPKVALPRLSSLDVQLSGNLNATLAFLDHIIPSPRCSLQFGLGPDLVYGRQTYTEDEFLTLLAIFFRYSMGYLNANTIKRTSIDTGINFFKVEADRFLFRLYDIANVPTFVSSFFSKSNFQNFIASLDTVELLASGYFLQTILGLPDDPSKPAILPSLQTLKLTDIGVFSSSVVSFLERRRKAGLSIQNLHLTMWKDSICTVDLSPLEDFVGLQVVFCDGNQRKEYMCGSGNPGQLTLVAKYPIGELLTLKK